MTVSMMWHHRVLEKLSNAKYHFRAPQGQLLRASVDLRGFHHHPDSSRPQGFCDGYGNLFRQPLLNCGGDKRLR